MTTLQPRRLDCRRRSPPRWSWPSRPSWRRRSSSTWEGSCCLLRLPWPEIMSASLHYFTQGVNFEAPLRHGRNGRDGATSHSIPLFNLGLTQENILHPFLENECPFSQNRNTIHDTTRRRATGNRTHNTMRLNTFCAPLPFSLKRVTNKQEQSVINWPINFMLSISIYVLYTNVLVKKWRVRHMHSYITRQTQTEVKKRNRNKRLCLEFLEEGRVI